MGNDGVHRLDKARWGLETALRREGTTLPTTPRAVSAHGGKHYFDDEEANQHLTRPEYRAPWVLPKIAEL